MNALVLLVLLYSYYHTNEMVLIFLYLILLLCFFINIAITNSYNRQGLYLILMTFPILFYQAIVWADVKLALQYYRLYFGFWIFYIFLSYYRNLNLKIIFYLVALITILEKILMVISPGIIEVLPNYSDGTFQFTQASSLFSGLNGIGGSRSVSSMIMLLFTIYFIITKEKILMYVSLIIGSLYMSGAYFVSLFIVFATLNFKLLLLAFVRARLSMRSFFMITVLLAVLGIVFLGFEFGPRHSLSGSTTKKVSLAYFEFLYSYKAAQVQAYLENLDVMKFLLGKGSDGVIIGESETDYGLFFGDFYLLDLLSTTGLLGFIFIFASVYLLCPREDSMIVSLVILLSLMHYSILSFVPGQVAIALVLLGLRLYRSEASVYPTKDPEKVQ